MNAPWHRNEVMQPKQAPDSFAFVKDEINNQREQKYRIQKYNNGSCDCEESHIKCTECTKTIRSVK